MDTILDTLPQNNSTILVIRPLNLKSVIKQCVMFVNTGCFTAISKKVALVIHDA